MNTLHSSNCITLIDNSIDRGSPLYITEQQEDQIKCVSLFAVFVLDVNFVLRCNVSSIKKAIVCNCFTIGQRLLCTTVKPVTGCRP